MHRVVDISLSGHADPFRLHEDAYAALTRYLEAARSRLTADPDREDVIGDLELSIGEKLTNRLSPDTHVIGIGDIHAILEEVGAVDSEAGEPSSIPGARRPARRRLYRIKEGQQIAGVCQGLAAYSDIGVDWVRTIFVLLAIFTAGVFLLVYLAMAFILPVVETREEYLAALEPHAAPKGMEQLH